MTTGDKSEIRILSAFLLLYITILGLICYLKLDSCQYTDFDLAVHTQSLHNMLDGSLECSILGLPYPGNHMALSPPHCTPVLPDALPRNNIHVTVSILPL